MFTIDNTCIDYETGEEALKLLLEELGEDFLDRYKRIRSVIMQKKIGQDYLLSRKVNCSHPTFMQMYPDVGEDTFNLLTTDLVIRGEAMMFILKKQMGVDIMKRYNQIKKSIIKRKLKRKLDNGCPNQMGLKDVVTKKSEITLFPFLPIVENYLVKIIQRLICGLKYLCSKIFRK